MIRDLVKNFKQEAVFENAKNFEEHRLTFEKKEKWLAYVIAGISFTFGILSLIALLLLLPLKRTDVEVFTVDAQTGRTEKITTVTKAKLTESQALAKYFTSSYITYRESYNYFRLQQDYDATLIFGTESINQSYIDLFNSNISPVKVYHNADYTVTVNMISIILADSSNPNDPEKLATVRFEKVVKAIASREMKKEYWTVRMTYQFLPERRLNERDRELNPLGFTVTSYLAEKDLRSAK